MQSKVIYPPFRCATNTEPNKILTQNEIWSVFDNRINSFNEAQKARGQKPKKCSVDKVERKLTEAS